MCGARPGPPPADNNKARSLILAVFHVNFHILAHPEVEHSLPEIPCPRYSDVPNFFKSGRTGMLAAL